MTKFVDTPLSQLFVATLPPKLTLPVRTYEQGEEEVAKRVPVLEPEYKFPLEPVRDFFAWYNHNNEPFFMFGPTGCGKSTFARQVCNRLNLPMYRLTIHEETMIDEIFGHYVLVPNGTEFRYGPGTLAALNGGVLLLEEFSRGDPVRMVGLNGLLEDCTKPFVIPANGEVIQPAAGFRIMLTDNTNLAGDESGGYNTANIHDVSIPDRIGMAVEFGYPVDEERERVAEVLQSKMDDQSLKYWLDQEGVKVSVGQGVKQGGAVTRDEFIDAICKVRDMVRKQSRDGGNDQHNALERGISARTLIRWVSYCAAFSGAPNRGKSAIHYALSRALTNTCTSSSKVAIHAIVESVFGVKPDL